MKPSNSNQNSKKKRLFDILFSLAILISLSPLFILIALIIKLSSKGDIIFHQVRVGKGGVPFKCYKFRTMYSDAEMRLKEILKENPLMQLEWNTFYKLKNDPRISQVGSILRKTSLDELPQFWNVLKGDISVIGPRPVTEDEIFKYYGEKAKKILSIRPGITGLWQISGRSKVSYEKRVELDERYLNDRTFFLDLKILAKTLPSMISKRGAY